ncbi:dCTP deaminase [Pseudomonas nitroreducens]|uniref:dCTP deaminase n=1 Tax=Pseudomonas nitroreducens TaxID=46680 RepID=UPI002657C78B|nr:deoxycytidine deaminase [Pseudomonas nitroreducens]MCP1651524.1 deoxycytidine triphosphate deaminase [Pseudomonas nitroreducens]MCP1689250.1 deoxycytidine triphosphate deaminase [Pseudomonas nitroreducens]
MIQAPASLLSLIKEGKIIKNLSQRELDSPEGVGFDLRIAKLFILSPEEGSLKCKTRRTPDTTEVTPDRNNCYHLKPGAVYLATTMEEFDLPRNLAAVFYPRSTLFRSGVCFESSILPPGYIGPMTFTVINNHKKEFEIEIGARFAHAVFHTTTGDADDYKGQWQGGRISQPRDEDQI